MHGYDGRCRHLSRDEVQARKREGKKYTVRFKVGSSRVLVRDRCGRDTVYAVRDIGWAPGTLPGCCVFSRATAV